MLKEVFVKFAFRLISNSITVEQEYEVSQQLINFFGLLGALLPFSYAVVPNYKIFFGDESFIFLAKLVRPYLFFNHQEVTQGLLSYIFYFGILISLINIGLQGANTQYLIKLNHKFSLISRTAFLMNQIFDVYLFNIIVEVILLQEKAYSYIITSIYCCILFYRIALTKVSIIFKYHTFNHQNQSFYYYCIQILNITQILLYVQSSESRFLQLLQVAISIIICSLNIANILTYLPQTNLSLLKLQLPTFLNSGFYCFGVLINQFQDVENHSPQMLFILLWPFWIKISQYQFENLLIVSQDLENYQNKIIHIFYQNQFDEANIKTVFYKRNLSQKVFKLNELFKKKGKNKTNFNILEKIKIKDQQQHFSLLLLFEDYFGAYEYITKEITSTSIIQQIKFDICSLKCKLELKQQMIMYSQTLHNKVFNLDVENFIKVESKSQELNDQLIRDCQLKIKYLSLINKNEIQRSKLEKQANLCIQKFEKIIFEIELLYKQFPLKRYQRYLIFAYAELCNDFLQAIRVMNLTSFNDEAIYTKILSLNLDFYSIKTIYLITDLENRKVLKVSSNYKNVMKSHISKLEEIIPKGVKEYHEEMINNFLKTGESNFFQETTSTFYQNEDFITPITIINDVFIQNNHINSITIATVPNEDQITLIVDANLNISGITRGFLDSLEISHDYCKYLTGIKIGLVIPEFIELSQNDQVQYIELRFLSGFQLQKYLDLIQRNFNSKQQQILINDLWHDKSKLDTYISHCNIIKSKYGFYKVNFNYIKNKIKVPMRNLTLKTYAQISVHDKDDMDEQVNIISPYEQQDYLMEKQEAEAFGVNKSEVLISGRDHQTLALIDVDKDVEFHNSRNNQQTIIRPTTFQNIFQSQQDIAGEEEQQSYSIEENNKKQYYSVKNISKYGIFEKIRQNNTISKSSRLLVIVLIFNQVLFLNQILISIISSLNVLDQNNVDIDLLQIKYYLFQPVESFIVTRYTIINYNAQFSAKAITKNQLDKYLVFPNSNLNLGFDDVQSNQAAILNRLTLQDFLAEYYDFYIYIKTDVGELYNITMRQSLSILINYQYTFKAAYKYDGRTVSDSPYIFYSYRNLLTLYNAFDLLNQQLFIQTIQRIELDLDKELTLFYPFIILQIIFLGLEIYFQYKNEQFLSKFFLLLLYCDQQVIQQEIKRLNKFVEMYNNKSEQILPIQFKIENKEDEIAEYKNHSVTSIKQTEKQRSIKLTIRNKYIVLLFQSIILISFGLLKYFVMKNYQNKYEPTCEFYLEMSYLGTNIPTIYAMREVLYYRWRYPFYKDEEISQILIQVETCLQQVQNFTFYLSQIQMDEFVLSHNFYQYLEELSNSNLCDMLSQDLITKSKDLCFSTLGGSLQKGLQGALVFVYSSINNEKQINLFLNKTENTVNELEGVFILSELIKKVNVAFKDDFLSQAKLVQDSLFIISIIYLLFMITTLVIIFAIINPYLFKQFYYARRYLYLIPQVVIYGDAAFERQMKLLFKISS
ncbi:unnamed protein product [Paramecium pentaurelia]|uniref:Transmembrane protein n=1 Tax=Paramecium pentaurelia TaxID=43138 RepID=A0A8S1XA41_9CILI|nr:unnamed protein product [Paramecium pentaurelia]